LIAEILSIGTELLMGQIANTNAQFISKHFSEVDIFVYYHSVVGDNKKRIKSSLLLALERADVVITTGGLGPTQDDITKEVISEVLNKPLVVREDILSEIKQFFIEKGKVMTPNNEKQAYFPLDSILIKNKMGTAPGCLIEHNNKIIIMLPGPPSEMRPMFLQFVIPFFAKKGNYQLKSKFIRIFGIGESAMESKISDLISSQSNPTIAPYAKQGEVTLRVTARYNQENENADDILNPTIKKIKERLGEYIYSYDNEELKVVAYKKLYNSNIKISLAESCTGGLLAKYITDIPGSSSIFESSIVTYSNDSKIKLLGVQKSTIDKYGAVSEQVVIEMAKGLYKKTLSQLVVAITGIAGPSGGTKDKPVGLIYISLGYKGKIKVRKLNLWGSRDRIRHVTCLNAFDFIIKTITEEEIN